MKNLKLSLMLVMFITILSTVNLLLIEVTLEVNIEGITDEISSFKTAPEFQHVITNVECFITDINTNSVYTIINGSVTVPIGEYIITARSNVDSDLNPISHKFISFNIIKNIVINRDMSITLHPEPMQVLLTVENADEVPSTIDLGNNKNIEENNVTFFLSEETELYYVYITNWTGGINFSSGYYQTNAEITLGNRYHYRLNNVGIVIDLDDWSVVNSISTKLRDYFWTEDGKFTRSMDDSGIKLWGRRFSTISI